MIRKIMLDIDGVCNQLIMHALEVNGCPVSRFDDSGWPHVGSYDIVAAANVWLDPAVTVAQFWNRITRDVWASSPASHEYDRFLKFAEAKVGKSNICFLTSPTIDPDCLAGKLEWIQRHSPSWMHRQYLVGPRKHFCAHPETLLIDDSDHNVNEFREHGGQAILVPRPWNSRWRERPATAIHELSQI